MKAREFRFEEEFTLGLKEQAEKERAVEDSKGKGRIIDSLRVSEELGNMTPQKERFFSSVNVRGKEIKMKAIIEVIIF